jgi:hypothetical protein
VFASEALVDAGVAWHPTGRATEDGNLGPADADAELAVTVGEMFRQASGLTAGKGRQRDPDPESVAIEEVGEVEVHQPGQGADDRGVAPRPGAEATLARKRGEVERIAVAVLDEPGVEPPVGPQGTRSDDRQPELLPVQLLSPW